MTANSFDPHALLAESRLGVLATIKADGRPQLSPVMPFYDRQANIVYVSMRAGLAKGGDPRPGSAGAAGGRPPRRRGGGNRRGHRHADRAGDRPTRTGGR